MPDVLVYHGSSGGRPLHHWHLTPGQAVPHTTPQVRLPCKQKGSRLGLLRVDIQFVAKLALLVYIGVRFIRAHLPPPQLRGFPRLQGVEVTP